VTTPRTPKGWAIRLSKVIKVFHDVHGLDRFPIKVAEVAIDFSRQVFPEAPITLIRGKDFSDKFEGMLLPHPSGNGEWGIVYNDSITSKGRINFTLAHELGHYLLHRQMSADGNRCSTHDMFRWDSEYGQMEADANTFASFLLLPLDDFREQVRNARMSIDLARHLSDRYEVSLTAAILKWLSITDARAMIVVGRDGFIDWAWSSESLFRSGVFYRARQVTTPLPGQSLAARADPLADNETGTIHPRGVWPGDQEVREMTVLAPKSELTITLLLYPNEVPAQCPTPPAEDE